MADVALDIAQGLVGAAQLAYRGARWAQPRLVAKRPLAPLFNPPEYEGQRPLYPDQSPADFMSAKRLRTVAPIRTPARTPITAPETTGYYGRKVLLGKMSKRKFTKRGKMTPRKVRAIVESQVLQRKMVESTQTSTTVTQAGLAAVCLNDLSQGSSEGARIGMEIRNLRLCFKGNVQLAATAAADTYRLTILIDHECRGALCTYVDVFQDTGLTNLPISLYNFDTRDRFTILFDQTFTLNNKSAPGAGAVGDLQSFEVCIPLRFKTTYSGNAGTISDIVKNSLCVLQSATNGTCNAHWYAQLEFESA